MHSLLIGSMRLLVHATPAPILYKARSKSWTEVVFLWTPPVGWELWHSWLESRNFALFLGAPFLRCSIDLLHFQIQPLSAGSSDWIHETRTCRHCLRYLELWWLMTTWHLCTDTNPKFCFFLFFYEILPHSRKLPGSPWELLLQGGSCLRSSTEWQRCFG